MLLLVLIAVSLYSTLGYPTQFEPFADAVSTTSKTTSDKEKKKLTDDSNKVTRLYSERDFKGESIDIPTRTGIKITLGGPKQGEDEKKYKRQDFKSFLVPQGVQLIVLSLVGDKPSIHKYAAGSYNNITIPDVKGQLIIVTSDK